MKSILVIGILLLAVVLFFADVLFGPRVFLDANQYHFEPWRHYASEGDLDHKTHRTDALFTYYPRKLHLHNAVLGGRFPLWNPEILFGMPFFADPQTRVLYPFELLLVPLDPVTAMGLDVALHFLIAMIGMYLFLRSISVSTMGSLLGALTYPLSSFFYVRLGHPTFIATAAWVPWFFYAFELARKSEWKGTLLLTGALAMGYLAGFPQVFMFGVGGLAVYALYISLDAERTARGRRILRNSRIIVVSGFLAILLVSVQLVPFAELTRNSTGLEVELDKMRTVFITPPLLLLRSFFPNLFGNPVEGTDWSDLTREAVHTYNPDFAIYCGLGILLAAVGGIAFAGREKRIRALLILCVLSIGVATSPHLITLGYMLLPPLRASKVSRVSVLGCFSLCAMAGIGFSMVSARLHSKGDANLDSRLKRRFLLIVGTTVVVVLVVGLGLILSGESFLESFRAKAESLPAKTWLPTHAQQRSGQIKEWVETGSAGWLHYEHRQVRRGLLLVTLSGSILLLYASFGRRRRGLGTVLGIVFVVVVVLDAGLTARTYFVSQVSQDLFKTQGIELLEEVLDGGNKWRLFHVKYEGEDLKALPPNTNQVFGLPSMTGASTIRPMSYTDITDAFGEGGSPIPRLDRQAQQPRKQIIATDFASGRYGVASSGGTPAPASAPLRIIAGRAGSNAPVRLLSHGGETRMALLHQPGQTMNVTMEIPRVRFLDFSIGFDSDARTPGDTVEFWLTWAEGHREVRFRKAFDLKNDRDAWHPFSLDVSSVARGHVRMQMGMSVEGSRGAAPRDAGWSGLDLVLGDCAGSGLPGNYEIDIPGTAEFIKIGLRSDSREVPLEIGLKEDLRRIRWISFPPHMPAREVTIDVRERDADRISVTSDSAFVLNHARVVHIGKGYPDYDLIWDTDMYIYENFSAIEKGVCIDRNAVEYLVSNGKTVLWIGRFNEVDGGLRCGRSVIKTYEPERVVIEVKAERDCFLLFQDSYYPGWKATVDGRRVRIEQTDIGMRAIKVDKGPHEIEMVFRPGSLMLGAVLTLIGALLTAAYAWKARPSIRVD